MGGQTSWEWTPFKPIRWLVPWEKIKFGNLKNKENRQNRAILLAFSIIFCFSVSFYFSHMTPRLRRRARPTEEVMQL